MNGDNRGVIEVTEPQVWTMIVGTIGSFVALIGLVTTWFTRVVTTEIRGVRSEIGSLRREIDVRFGHLDRDVAALSRRVFEQPE